MNFPERIFVAGTDTDVGKTLVSAVLTLGLGAHYYKPFQTGRRVGIDRDWVAQKTELGPEHFSPEGACYEEPLSPHLAAQLERQRIEPTSVELPQVNQRHLVIEGAGGVLVPLNEKELLVDWIALRELPVVLVARSGLGTINHSLMSLEALRCRGIEVLGVVLNGEKNQPNAEAIAHYGNCPVLAQIERINQINRASLEAAWNSFDRT